VVKSHEEQFQTFLSLAHSWGMNIELYPGLDKYFQDLNTQTSWMMFTNAYWKGVMDADTERREKGIYYV
jgi:hypothetical protein